MRWLTVTQVRDWVTVNQHEYESIHIGQHWSEEGSTS